MPKKKNVQSREEVWMPAPPKQDAHPYDNTLKAWFGEDAKLILPEFLPGIELLGENSGERRRLCKR